MMKKSDKRVYGLTTRPSEKVDLVDTIIRSNGFHELIRTQREWTRRYSNDALELLQKAVAGQEKINLRRLRSAGRSSQEWLESVGMDQDEENRYERLVEIFVRLALQGRRAYGLPLPDPDECEKRAKAGVPLSSADDPDEEEELEDRESKTQEKRNSPSEKSISDEPT